LLEAHVGVLHILIASKGRRTSQESIARADHAVDVHTLTRSSKNESIRIMFTIR
jgi:hypothetical protein